MVGKIKNKKDMYGLENEEGKIVATFRLKQTAIQMKPEYQKVRMEKLKIVTLER